MESGRIESGGMKREGMESGGMERGETMRIAYLASGAAGMYCGTCIHDNTLATALMAEGHEVVLVPTYTPIRTDEEDVSSERIFYGAVNVYLRQKLRFFGRAPGFVRWVLDRPALLRWVSRFADATDSASFGETTLSVLRGPDGPQAGELARMLDWLATFRPDVVQLNQVMFAGFAGEIRQRLGVPVTCSLTGEDLFLDYLEEPHKGLVMDELVRRARDIDAFLAPCRFYADFMAGYLSLPREKVHVVPLGVNLGAVRTPAASAPSRPPGEAPFTVGYLARICPEKGLHVLLEAFRELAGRHPGRVRLKVGGYLGRQYEPYLAEQKGRVLEWGLGPQVDFLGELDREGKHRLLASVDAFSVPATYGEPKGLYVLEALANGVPVVEPRRGSFPELLEATGGGILVEPDSPSALAEGLEALLLDPDHRRALGDRGRRAVEERFDHGTMARSTLAVYERVLAARTPVAVAGPLPAPTAVREPAR